VVDRIEYFQRVLGDKNASRDDRIEALKFIVHFVGDIYRFFFLLASRACTAFLAISERRAELNSLVQGLHAKRISA